MLATIQRNVPKPVLENLLVWRFDNVVSAKPVIQRIHCRWSTWWSYRFYLLIYRI